MQDSIQKIGFIGSGNVATNLAFAMFNAGFTITQIISKSIENASLLASGVNADFSDKLSEITSDADLFIISVNDTVLPQICKTLRLPGKLVVHTSGYASIDMLNEVTERNGVFYPLQSFVKQRLVDLKNIPVCIETSQKSDIVILGEFAEKLSLAIKFIDSQKRKQLHLAAVFACNFPNFMYGIAEEILAEHNMSFNLLIPLIKETSGRVAEKSPELLQTGPARRKDMAIVQDHLNMISNKDYKEIYEMLSRLIIKKYYPDEKL
jgi:predicted short-subunit dehydrogenase-like oxidoreductase (DUF2520 family)